MSHEMAKETHSDSETEVGSVLDDGDLKKPVDEEEHRQIQQELKHQEEELDRTPYKVVLVGDADVGKAALLDALRARAVEAEVEQPAQRADDPQGYAAPVKYVHKSDAKDVLYKNLAEPTMLFHNTGSADKDVHLRTLVYADADAVLLCFCVNDRASFDNAHTKWKAEVAHFCPGIPMTLLGLQGDAAAGASGKAVVTFKEAQKRAIKSGFMAYIDYRTADDEQKKLSEIAAQCASDARYGRLIRRRKLLGTDNETELPLPERILLYTMGALTVPPTLIVAGIGNTFQSGFGLRPLMKKIRQRSQQSKAESSAAGS